MDWSVWFRELIVVFNKVVIIYFFLLNSLYLILLFLGLGAIVDYFRRRSFAGYEFALKSKLTLPISILVPAYNEEKVIVESVKSLLSLNYPEFEVIIINDGSSDDTLDVLSQEFKLRRVDKVFKFSILTKPVKGIYVSTIQENLLVIDKENGGKADALSAGLNFSKFPLFCSVDADSMLEDEALIRVVKPFLEKPNEVVASGGIIRVANGCSVKGGRVIEVRTPSNYIANFQAVEYLRAFLAGRTGWSALNSLFIISGAFALFRKDVVMEIGGFRTDTVTEDAELVVHIHRHLKEQGKKYRILFIPDPICWTEVPESFRMLARQRNRWHRGLIETLWAHKRMLLNPRYGRIGLFAMPYFFFFEMLGPLFEVLGYTVILLSFAAGILDINFFALFFLVAILYGVMLSVGAILIEEFSFSRYERWSDIWKLVLYSVLENFGYRQILSLLRSWSFITYFRRKKHWGHIARHGFRAKPA